MVISFPWGRHDFALRDDDTTAAKLGPWTSHSGWNGKCSMESLFMLKENWDICRCFAVIVNFPWGRHDFALRDDDTTAAKLGPWTSTV